MTGESVERPIPKTREEFAMEKVVDPSSKPFYYYHQRQFDPVKIRDILREGLIAPKVAERIKKQNYEMELSHSVSERIHGLVFLMHEAPPFALKDYMCFLVDNIKVKLLNDDEI